MNGKLCLYNSKFGVSDRIQPEKARSESGGVVKFQGPFAWPMPHCRAQESFGEKAEKRPTLIGKLEERAFVPQTTTPADLLEREPEASELLDI